MSSIELWVASGLLDVSIKAALLALAAGVGMAACRVRSGTVRHRVWFLVLVGILLLPALVNLAPGVSLPGWLYPALQLAAATGETDGGTRSASVQQPAADGLNVPAPSGPRSALPIKELGPATHARDAATHGMAGQEPREAAAIPLPALPASAVPSAAPRAVGSSGFALAIIGVYLAGVALLMVRLLIGMLQACRLAGRASQVDLPRNVTWRPTGARILKSDEVRVPVTIGYWWPTVVLPADWKTWSNSSLEMVLAHEAEHVRRHDTWIALLATLNCAVYWFHPVAWFVRRRLTDLAEQICDDVVIRVTGSRKEYAQNLLDLAGRVTAGSGRLRPVGVAMARKANVVKRIQAILDNDRPLSRRIGAVRAVLLVCIVAPLVLLTVGLRATTPTVAASAPAADAVQDDPMADPLPAQVAIRLGTARYRHGSRIGSMAVSADGKLAVTASGYGSFNPALAGLFSPARVFDLTDGRCLYSLPNEPGSYTEAVGLSPDGTTLATKDDKFLYFRDAATGKELRKLEYLPDSGGGRSITDWMTFTPDGKQVAVTLMGDAVQLIDVGTGKVTRTFAPDAAASACVFSPDGKRMATGGYEREKGVYLARLWEVGTGKELRRFPAGLFPAGNGRKRALAFSPDGATLAGGGWGDARLRLWETATGKELNVFPKIGEDIVSVAFAPDGKTVAAASDRIYLYDPVTAKERFRIERRARGLAFSRDGSVLTGAVSGAIYRWDAASGRQLTPAEAQDSAVEQILVAADGRRVFSTDQDGDLYVWDAAGGKPPRRIAGGIERGVVASPDGRFLAWAVAIDSRPPDPSGRKWYQIASRVRLYDVAGQRVIDRFPGFADHVAVAAFLPDGKTLLTLGGGFGDATVRLWDVESGKERRSFTVVAPKSDAKVPGAARTSAGMPFYTTRRAALSPDGRMLAIGPDWEENFSVGRDESVRLWDVATGTAGPELNKPTNVLGVPDEAGTGKIRDTAMVRVNRHMKSAHGRAFSPDGRLLVDWAENPFGRSRMDHVVVWDVATGRAVATLAAGPRPGAANAAFAPDGRTLATASADGIVRLWEVATWKVRAEFRGHRDRVTALAFGPNGRLFTGGLDTVVLGWDVQPPRGTAIGE